MGSQKCGKSKGESDGLGGGKWHQVVDESREASDLQGQSGRRKQGERQLPGRARCMAIFVQTQRGGDSHLINNFPNRPDFRHIRVLAGLALFEDVHMVVCHALLEAGDNVRE